MDDEACGWLRDPRDGSALSKVDEHRICFAGGHSYPVHQGTPILLVVEERSLFNSDQIIRNIPTTEIVDRGRFGRMKVCLRRQVLPCLSFDHGLSERRRALARLLSPGPVLILGAGRRGEIYRALFQDHKVVVRDVHCQYGVDFVIDAHDIPFPKDTFSLVLAAQVLEHTAQPWRVAEEMQRVTKQGGYIQIEAPFVFPYHAAPYDFFRFTPSALRFLFRECELTQLVASEGAWSGSAVALSHAFIDCFSNRYARWSSLALSRLSLWWMKYLDRLASVKTLNMPKGFAATYRFDGMARSDRELLEEVQLLPNLLSHDRARSKTGAREARTSCNHTIR